MSRKLNVGMTGPHKETKCCHYWFIGQPEKGFSNGRCRICGEEKKFKNFYDIRVNGDESSELTDLNSSSGLNNNNPKPMLIA